MSTSAKSIVLRSISDTFEFFDWRIKQIVWPLLFGAGLAFRWWREGDPKPVIEELEHYLFYGLAPVLGFAFLLFVWNLICAPYRIVRDSHNKVAQELESLRLRTGDMQRPRFKIEGPRIEQSGGRTNDLRIVVPFRNVGFPSKELKIKIFMLDLDGNVHFNTEQVILERIEKDEPSFWTTGVRTSENSPESLGCSVVESLDLTDETHQDVRFMVWPGSEAGIVETNLFQVNAEQRDIISAAVLSADPDAFNLDDI